MFITKVRKKEENPILLIESFPQMFWMPIVGIYLIETRIMANIRYFPKSGTTSDVGGIISTTRRKNTYKLVKIEMDNVTWKDR